METKFKVGDIIEITEVGDILYPNFFVGDVGVIRKIINNYYRVDFSGQNNKTMVLDGVWCINNTISNVSNKEYAQFKLYREEKPRFHDAQEGDEVYCRLRGEGIIKSITYSERYPLECLFCDNCTPFDYDGRSQKDHFEPTLFYRKDSEKYLTERPEPEYEVDWSKVYKYTDVYCADSEECLENNETENILVKEKFAFYRHGLEFPFWVYDGREDKACGYKYCKLAETCKPEWRK